MTTIRTTASTSTPRSAKTRTTRTTSSPARTPVSRNARLRAGATSGSTDRWSATCPLEQVGKLTPTYQQTGDGPENYGCGFLPDGRLVTTDVGDQQPGTPPNGQLIVWFPPFNSRQCATARSTSASQPRVASTSTPEGNVLVAAQRPGAPSTLDNGGIYRYNGNLLPTSDDAAGGCGQHDSTGAPMANPDRVKKSLFIGASPEGVLTPSAIAARPRGGYYVSSVFTGVIAQYDEDGRFVRRVLQPAIADAIPPYASGTPLGITVGPDGTIYYADLGVVLGPPPGPGNGNGTVRRIRFRDGRPLAPEVLEDGLDFPDGVGLVTVTGSPSAATLGTSSWGCGDWGMYGGNQARTFSTECASAISRTTASTVVPAWTFKTPKTVTASPVVVQGTVYVGDWTGTMYALRLSNGTERWHFTVKRAKGAAYGPIVSSAAVADAMVGWAAQAARRLRCRAAAVCVGRGERPAGLAGRHLERRQGHAGRDAVVAGRLQRPGLHRCRHPQPGRRPDRRSAGRPPRRRPCHRRAALQVRARARPESVWDAAASGRRRRSTPAAIG